MNQFNVNPNQYNTYGGNYQQPNQFNQSDRFGSPNMGYQSNQQQFNNNDPFNQQQFNNYNQGSMQYNTSDPFNQPTFNNNYNNYGGMQQQYNTNDPFNQPMPQYGMAQQYGQGGYVQGNFGGPGYPGGPNNMGGFGGPPNGGFGQQGGGVPSMGNPPQQPEKKKEIDYFASFDPLKK